MNKISEFFKSWLNFIIYILTQLILALLLRNYLINGTYFVKSAIYIGLDLLTITILIIVNFKRLKKDYQDFDINYQKCLKIGLEAWLIGLLVMCLSNYVINTYVLNDIANNEAVDRFVLSSYPLYSVIGMIIVGPFMEELVFRLGFKEHIKNKYLYYIVTVLLFAGMHVLNGISSPLELLYFIPYGALAFSFSYTLDKTNNIFTTTIIHTLHNTIAIILVSLMALLGA